MSVVQCFSQHDILALQNIASRCNVIIIPLVQTFGHMEVINLFLYYLEIAVINLLQLHYLVIQCIHRATFMWIFS